MLCSPLIGKRASLLKISRSLRCTWPIVCIYFLSHPHTHIYIIVIINWVSAPVYKFWLFHGNPDGFQASFHGFYLVSAILGYYTKLLSIGYSSGIIFVVFLLYKICFSAIYYL
ncbi:hypothetical protein CsSME_00041497 [Camellia sinensis var. sinensis]